MKKICIALLMYSLFGSIPMIIFGGDVSLTINEINGLSQKYTCVLKTGDMHDSVDIGDLLCEQLYTFGKHLEDCRERSDLKIKPMIMIYIKNQNRNSSQCVLSFDNEEHIFENKLLKSVFEKHPLISFKIGNYVRGIFKVSESESPQDQQAIIKPLNPQRNSLSQQSVNPIEQQNPAQNPPLIPFNDDDRFYFGDSTNINDSKKDHPINPIRGDDAGIGVIEKPKPIQSHKVNKKDELSFSAKIVAIAGGIITGISMLYVLSKINLCNQDLSPILERRFEQFANYVSHMTEQAKTFIPSRD